MTRAPRPVKIPNIKYATCVAAGINHTAIVTVDGKVLTFGSGRHAQLGYDGGFRQREPREVPGIQTAIGVSCGLHFTMVLLRDGNVVAFGENGRQNILGTTNHEMLLRTPSFVDLPYPGVIAVACGDYHSLFLLSNGRVAAVGINTNGQLGLDGDFENKAVPVLLPFDNVVSIFAWANSSAIIFTDGRMMLFMVSQARRAGRVGINILEFPRINDALAISGDPRFVIVHRDGRVSTEHSSGQPVDEGWFRDAIAVACGSSHTLIKHADGLVSSYGSGTEGQLGNGMTFQYQRVPAIVEGVGIF
jgi:alpha-tubulin suppressor-like RCC1 family protein